MSTVTQNEVQVPIIRPLWLNITEEPVIALRQLKSKVWIAALADGSLLALDPLQGHTLNKIKAHQMGLLGLNVHPTKSTILTRGEDNKIKIFNYDETGFQELKSYKASQWVDQAVFFNESVFFSSGKKLYRWNTNHAEPDLVETWSNSISTMQFNAKQELGIAGYSRLSTYNPETFELLKTYEWKGSLENLHFCTRHRFAVCSSNDNTIHIWDLKKDKDLAMRGFPQKILSLSFRSDGLYLANCSGPEVMIWDFMDPGPQGKRPQVLGPFEKSIEIVAYQFQGKMLATFGQDGVILFWRPDLFDDQPLAIAGIRDQAILSAQWSQDDQSVVTGLSTGYVACYPAPKVEDKSL